MLRGRLHQRLNRVGRESACEAQHYLTTDHPTDVPASVATPETHQHTHGDGEDAYAGDGEPFNVAEIANEETNDKPRKDGGEGVQEGDPSCREDGLVEGYDEDCVEITVRTK